MKTKLKKKQEAKPAKAAKKTKAAAPTAGDGTSRGLTTGKPVTEFWNGILAANEQKKNTDSQLVQVLKKEFPGRKYFQPTGRIRSFFNRGVQGYGNPPGVDVRGTSKQSHCYNENGIIVTGTNWGQDRKKDPKRSKAAAITAAKTWAKKKRSAKKDAPKAKRKPR